MVSGYSVRPPGKFPSPVRIAKTNFCPKWSKQTTAGVVGTSGSRPFQRRPRFPVYPILGKSSFPQVGVGRGQPFCFISLQACRVVALLRTGRAAGGSRVRPRGLILGPGWARSWGWCHQPQLKYFSWCKPYFRGGFGAVATKAENTVSAQPAHPGAHKRPSWLTGAQTSRNGRWILPTQRRTFFKL